MPAVARPSGPQEPADRRADAAVVIINYRTADLVESCLRSVQHGVAPLRLEIVIVDNDSRDGSAVRLRETCPDASVVEMPENRGFAAGVNEGFARTTAEVVVVINPDVELRADALDALVGHLHARPATGVVAPLLTDGAGRPVASAYRRFPGLAILALELCVPVGYALERVPRLHPYRLAPDVRRGAGSAPAHVTGAVMAISRRAFSQAGPFDEGFFLYLEETEWQQRVAAAGWAIEILPTAVAVHLVRGGGDAALAPSPHFVLSALRYLEMGGRPQALCRAVLALALASSWFTLLAIGASPRRRTRAHRQSVAYGRLLRLLLAGGGVR